MRKAKDILICTMGNKNLDKIVEFFGKDASLNIPKTGVIIKNLGCVSTMLRDSIEKVCKVEIIATIKF